MIEDKARELGRLIGQSEEYKILMRTNDSLRSDQPAVTVLQSMDKLRADAQALLARGEEPTADMERQLDAMLSQVQVMPAYQRMAAAQDNFDKLMHRVNEWIGDGIAKGAKSPIITLG